MTPLIREVCFTNAKPRCVVRADTYNGTFAHVERLVAAAREDFPELESDRIEVVKFGGQHYKRTVGIEFDIQDGQAVPPTYQPISSMEFIL